MQKEPNFYLKSQLILKDGTLTAAAKKLDMDYQRLCRIIHHRVKKIKPTEKQQIAAYLKQPKEHLFRENRCVA
jgi:hypothetical protein